MNNKGLQPEFLAGETASNGNVSTNKSVPHILWNYSTLPIEITAAFVFTSGKYRFCINLRRWWRAAKEGRVAKKIVRVVSADGKTLYAKAGTT